MADPILETLVVAISRAWEAGCPIATWEAHEQLAIANIALRRWRSFGRRRKKTSASERIEDLAKGLRDALEAAPKLVGPLMEDYRYLAGLLASVLNEVTSE